MAQKKPPRVLFNPEHVEVARDLLSDKDAGRLFFAIFDYAIEGKLPENESKSWMACFKLMRSDIDENARRYADQCERNRQNIKKRWEQQCNSVENDGIPSNTTVYDGIPSNTVDTNEYETYVKKDKIKKDKVEEYASPAGDDISAQIVAHQCADDLIRRYKLPDTDMSREALLEDAARVGFNQLEDALKKASLSNTRSGISVNFYRAVLNSSRTPKEVSGFGSFESF